MIEVLSYVAYAFFSFYMIFGIIKFVKGDTEEGARIIASTIILMILSLGSRTIIGYLFPEFELSAENAVEESVLISVIPNSGQEPLMVKVTILNIAGGEMDVLVSWGGEKERAETKARIIVLEHLFRSQGSYLVEVNVSTPSGTFYKEEVVEVYENPTEGYWGWSWILSQISKFIGFFIESVGMKIMSVFPIPDMLEALYFILFLPSSEDLNKIMDIYWSVSFPLALILLFPGLIINAIKKMEDPDAIFAWNRDLLIWILASGFFPYFYDALSRLINYIVAIIAMDSVPPFLSAISPLYTAVVTGLALSYFFPSIGNLALMFLMYVISLYAFGVFKFIFILSVVLLAPILMSLRLLLPWDALDSIFSLFFKLIIMGLLSGTSLLVMAYISENLANKSLEIMIITPILMLLLPVVILRLSGISITVFRARMPKR